MGEIRIQDTGYVRPTNAGTQASAGNMANSGNALLLKTARFIPSLKRNVQDDPELSSNSPTLINLGSLENMKFELRCILKVSNVIDMAKIPHLLDMVATNGYKVIWYDYSVAAEDNNGQLIYRIALNDLFGHPFTNGEKTAFSISDNFFHLHVLFTNIAPAQTGSKGTIEYILSGVVIKAEVSGI